ncbi:hypothetical protein Godav_006179 [Gossypium davidsonii]|uniref:DUF4283 domain-containing protein n=1 Tax=Gossypium davidsonii TaxID=34287 RepID=A0A7J8S4G6_GOSDV|nr:hypothetical protein [Gossypium davidsonii]
MENGMARICIIEEEDEAMRNTSANLWNSLGGTQISDLGEKRFLFRFFHLLDIKRVMKVHDLPPGVFSKPVAKIVGGLYWGYGDSFFPIWLRREVNETDLEWDISEVQKRDWGRLWECLWVGESTSYKQASADAETLSSPNCLLYGDKVDSNRMKKVFSFMA